MRKKFLTIIIIFGMLFIFSMVSYAEEGIVETDLLEETELLKETELIPAIEGLIPSSEEIEYLSRCMDDYKIGGEVTVEILYNRFNEAKFLMGISEKGYMILYRDTLADSVPLDTNGKELSGSKGAEGREFINLLFKLESEMKDLTLSVYGGMEV